MTNLDLKTLTIDEMRKLKKMNLPFGKSSISTNTYYRIINKNFKFHAQKRSLEKLREALNVSEEVFQAQLENQWNKK